MTAETDVADREAADREAENTIVYECELDAAPETVWRAVSIPEFLAEWIGFPPDAGTDGSNAAAYTIEESRPISHGRLRWQDEDAGMPESLVTIELSPAPEGRTFFRLTHDARALRPLAANENRQPMRMAA